MKRKDNHFPDPGSWKGQDQVPGFSGSHVHLSKARKQRACTMLPNGWSSILHLFCVYLCRTTENSLERTSWRGKQCSKPSKYQPALPLPRRGSHQWLRSPSAPQLRPPLQDAPLSAGRAGWWEATPCQPAMAIRAVTAQLPLQPAARCLPMSSFPHFRE